MYKVTKDGKVLTITSKLTHVKAQSNGVNIIDPNGPGVVIDGTIYNLPGYENVQIEEVMDDRYLINEIIAKSATTDDIYVALAELGNLIAGGE